MESPWDIAKGLYLYEINGEVVEYKLTLQFDDFKSFSFVIFDNKAVFHYWNNQGQYMIVNLLTNERENIQIEKINGVYPFDDVGILYGYDGKSLIYYNGYYDISESSYHFFEIKLQHFRYQSVGNLMIGLDDDGFIAYHNIYSNTVEKTSVKRNSPSPFYSTSSDSYYIDLDGRYLYYSKEKHGLLLALLPPDSFFTVIVVSFFVPLLPLWPMAADLALAKDWYRYNLDKGTTEYVMVPGNRSWEIIELLRTEPE